MPSHLFSFLCILKTTENNNNFPSNGFIAQDIHLRWNITHHQDCSPCFSVDLLGSVRFCSSELSDCRCLMLDRLPLLSTREFRSHRWKSHGEWIPKLGPRGVEREPDPRRMNKYKCKKYFRRKKEMRWDSPVIRSVSHREALSCSSAPDDGRLCYNITTWGVSLKKSQRSPRVQPPAVYSHH